MSTDIAVSTSVDIAEIERLEVDALDAIGRVTDPSEAERLLGKVRAVQEAQRFLRLGAEYEKRWGVLRLKAERKYGVLLGPAVLGRQRNSDKVAGSNLNSAEKSAAHKARQVAQVPDEVFHEFIENEDEPTRAGLLRRVAARKDSKAKRKSTAALDAKRAADENAGVGAATLRHGDYVEHVGELIDGSVDVILTDPPYGADYKSGRRWASSHRRIEGDNNLEDALTLTVAAIRALLPALSDSGHVLIFCRWKEEPQLRETLAAIEELDLRGSLIWVKNEPGMGDLKGTFGPAHERILHLARPSAEMRIRVGDVLTAARVVSKDHPTEKPVELLATLINALTEPGDLVVDPFAGSASTLRAAVANGRNAWGCELDAEYAKAGQELLEEVVARG
jgi:site-specific DNA-methyltransferase (adenine-specific)